MNNTHLKEELAHQKTCNDIKGMTIEILEAHNELLESRCRELERELICYKGITRG